MANDNDRFEQQWRDAMEGGEITPPAHIWSGVDAELSKMEVATYKRKAAIYKWIAAACAACIVLTTGTLFYQNYYYNNTNQLAFTQNSTFVANLDTSCDDGNDAMQNNTFLADHSEQRCPENNITNNPTYMLASAKSRQKITPAKASTEDSRPTFDNTNNNQLASTNLAAKPNIDYSVAGVNAKEVTHPNKPAGYQGQFYGVAYQRDIDDIYEEAYASLWAGLKVGAGSFDAGTAGTNETVVASSDEFSADYSAGSTVSGGIDIGHRLTKRIVVSSGLHYNTISTGNVSQTYAEPVALFNDLEEDGFENFSASETPTRAKSARAVPAALQLEEVTSRNQFEYVTIPLRAGYMILDKKLNITLNSGIASNILVNAERVSSKSSLNEKNTDQYQSIYFNLLSSVEFGYTVKDRYLFTVEPNYNQAISDFTNSNNASSGRPRNFGVAMGVRYSF